MLDESVDSHKILGLLLGLSGLGVLIGSDLVILKRAPIGAFFMLLAAISWAIGTVLLKRINWQIPTLSNIAWQRAQPARRHRPDLPVPVPDELLPVGLFQNGRAFFKTVGLLPASIAAIGTLMVPVVGVYSSHLILGEKVGLNDLLALLLVLSALILVLVLPAWKLRRLGTIEHGEN
jgi:drug/metabolite transporter (DMT)-like permease